jgi:hypothetical protein
MPVLAECSSCGSKLKIPDNMLGRKVKCPKCGTITVVDGRDEPPSAGVRAARDDAEDLSPVRSPAPSRRDNDYDDDRPSRRPRDDDYDKDRRRPRDDDYDDDRPRQQSIRDPAQQNGAALGLGIGSLVLGIIALLFAFIPCIGWWSMPVSGLGLVLGIIGFVMVIASKRGGLGFPIAGSSVNVAALAMGAVWLLLCTGLMNSTKNASQQLASEVEKAQKAAQEAAEAAQKRAKEAKEAEEAKWIDASKGAQTQGSVAVTVTSVTLGFADMDDGKGGTTKSVDSNNMVIHLNIKNVSPRPLTYRGWSQANLFGGDKAILQDRLPTPWAHTIFVGNQKVKGQVTNQQLIQPGKTIDDVLVFMAPPKDRAPFRLELPASAIGALESIKFKIPESMIKDTRR